MFSDSEICFWQTASSKAPVWMWLDDRLNFELYICIHEQVASRPTRLGKLNRQFVETPAWVWMVKGLQRRALFQKIASELRCNFGSSVLLPEKTIAYLPSPQPASLAHASLSASDNISIQALPSTQTPMSYLAAQARRINCWSTQSL